MIIVGLILLLLAVLGAPLFAIIATSAMLGFRREDTDLMNMALEIRGDLERALVSSDLSRRFMGDDRRHYNPIMARQLARK